MSISREQELKSGMDSLERYILVFAGLVVIGVVLEAVFNSATCLHKIGGYIVAIGLAAELALGIRLLRNEHELRGLLDATIARLNEQAEHERLERIKIQQSAAGNLFAGGL